MKETLQKIKDLKTQIDYLTAASKKHNHVIDEMVLQADTLPQDVKVFVNNLPVTINDSIQQALDEEFNISLNTLNTKPIQSRIKRPIRGIRI
ncbi:MAG: hypothetical protein ACI8SR_000285 [Oceanicoccus sp.]|jgi:hypothetical protein